MQKEKIIIIGAGPCGLSAAIELQQRGYDPLVIEKGNIVEAIYRYPTHQQFFSTSEKLSIGGIPFYSTERKPKRNEALVYYRKVVEEKQVRVHAYETVTGVERDTSFTVTTKKKGGVRKYEAEAVVIATGYYDSPNYMNIKGEHQPHVYHYFHEAHPFFGQKTAVIGGKNSAVDAALELEKAGADVTVYYRGSSYSSSIKPWILPEFDSLVRKHAIRMHFDSSVEEIKESTLLARTPDGLLEEEADFVFAMTGYHPDHSFIRSIGVHVDEATGRPEADPETMETNVAGVYIAGVIAAGNNANEIFIENGRWHGEKIADHITSLVTADR
ncbi:YpdA family putative bacillithiol disulfide reductase [Alkalicoccus chagannorensis]|uniref:YpdA family putative bacillithiol disulfide reductase n=1 Tax=Alkalicoccus chagannorensis TaxID=427072 RepID=UPI00041800C2|nr:YpdA family putative bacillithiol disulfide reductase [Alkalicoccus chagannorensis]